MAHAGGRRVIRVGGVGGVDPSVDAYMTAKLVGPRKPPTAVGIRARIRLLARVRAIVRSQMVGPREAPVAHRTLIRLASNVHPHVPHILLQLREHLSVSGCLEGGIEIRFRRGRTSHGNGLAPGTSRELVSQENKHGKGADKR